MEYLKPLEQLKARIKFDQGVIYSLLVLLGILLIAVPHVLKDEPFLIQEIDSLPKVVRSEPWKLNISRIAGFAREYLEGRFHWSPENFTQARTKLVTISTDAVYQRMKDSFSANESIAQNQKAESFYVIEREAYSKAMDLAELQVTRVLRIRNVAVATPLVIKLSIQAVPVTGQNPYGLVISALEEAEMRVISEEGKQ